MKLRLLDLLVCPMCKNFPLELIVFSSRKVNREYKGVIPACELFCGFHRKNVSEINNFPCVECFKEEIEEGLLICNSCKRWYPIINEIARMLPDKLRKKNEDMQFLEKNKSKIPEKILYEGCRIT